MKTKERRISRTALLLLLLSQLQKTGLIILLEAEQGHSLIAAMMTQGGDRVSADVCRDFPSWFNGIFEYWVTVQWPVIPSIL